MRWRWTARAPAIALGLVAAAGVSVDPGCSSETVVGADGGADEGGRVLPLDAGAGRDASLPPAGADGSVATEGGEADSGVDAGPPAVEYVGRFEMRDGGAPVAEWSGSAMRARFTGSSVTAKLGGSGHFFEVVVDGVVQPTLEIDGGTSYLLASGLAPTSAHDIVVFRREEAAFNESSYGGFDFGEGGTLLPPAPVGRRIEMIGDSITCGFGDECTNASQGFSAPTENEYIAYGPIAARALGADVHVVAWQGRGLYRNLDGSTTETVPVLWERTIPTDPTSTWHPSRWIPDVVVINLGTNDYNAGGADPSASFQAAYLAFVTQLKSAYPNVFVFGAVGPMLGGTRYDSVKTAIANVVAARSAAGDDRMQLVEFPTQDCGSDGSGCGCGGHPNAAEHQKMAAILEGAIHVALGW